MSFLSRLVNVFRSDRVDDDLDDELRFHLEERKKALVAAGMTPEGPRRWERAEGWVTGWRSSERSRDIKLLGWLDTLFKDVRFGLRMLAQGLRRRVGGGALAVSGDGRVRLRRSR